MGVTLGIECSQRQGSVAVRGSDGVVKMTALESASGIDDQLMIVIDQLVRDVGARPRDLSLIGVSLGPGGFTGLRISMATAKVLAKTCQCALVGVPTAAVASQTWRQQTPAQADAKIGVALATKRCETWFTVISDDGPIGAGCLVDQQGLEDMMQANRPSIVLADATFPDELRQVVEQSGGTVHPLQCDSSACLVLAEASWRQGELVDPEALIPLYPREPEAVRVFQGPRG